MNSTRSVSRRRKSSRKSSPESLILMTPQTKDFIQKICYKKTATIDMTKNGFITECRMGPINAYVKPLRDQIQKIVETPKEEKRINPKRRRVPSPIPGSTLCRPAKLQIDPTQSEPSQSFSIESLNKFMTAKLQKKSVVFSL